MHKKGSFLSYELLEPRSTIHESLKPTSPQLPPEKKQKLLSKSCIQPPIHLIIHPSI